MKNQVKTYRVGGSYRPASFQEGGVHWMFYGLHWINTHTLPQLHTSAWLPPHHHQHTPSHPPPAQSQTTSQQHSVSRDRVQLYQHWPVWGGRRGWDVRGKGMEKGGGVREGFTDTAETCGNYMHLCLSILHVNDLPEGQYLNPHNTLKICSLISTQNCNSERTY